MKFVLASTIPPSLQTSKSHQKYREWWKALRWFCFHASRLSRLLRSMIPQTPFLHRHGQRIMQLCQTTMCLSLPLSHEIVSSVQRSCRESVIVHSAGAERWHGAIVEAALTFEADMTVNHMSFTVDRNDTDVILVSNASIFKASYIDVTKFGYSSNLLEASFYGFNAAMNIVGEPHQLASSITTAKWYSWLGQRIHRQLGSHQRHSAQWRSQHIFLWHWHDRHDPKCLAL